MASEPGPNAKTWGQEFVQSQVLGPQLERLEGWGLIAARGTLTHTHGI